MYSRIIFLTAMISLALFSGCIRNDVVDISADWKLSYEDEEGFKAPEYDDASWQAVDLPANLFREQKKQAIWIRKTFVIPESMRNRDLAVYLGRVLEVEWTYLNGVNIGSSGYDYPHYFSSWNVSR